MLAGVEPKLLPTILALIGEKHGQSDFYSSLLPMAPDLMSFIDRKAMITEAMAKNEAEITALISVLRARNNELNKRLTLIELGDSNQAGVDGDGESENGEKKRQRLR